MTNQLYPAFFRLDRLQLLVVGAGEVGEEKLSFILKSSPNARVVIVAPWMGEELRELLEGYQKEFHADFMARPQVQESWKTNRVDRRGLKSVFRNEPKRLIVDEVMKASEDGLFPKSRLKNRAIKLGETTYNYGDAVHGLYLTKAGGHVIFLKREFKPSDVETADLVVAATNFKDINHAVWTAAKSARRLTNIADTPSLCDFYLGSIVTRGPLKIAISTNGQSPTFAKRFRQFLEAELPDFETTNLLDNLKLFRDRLTGDFQVKVRQLNAVTNSLLSHITEDKAACRCPEGECLVAAAANASAPSTSTAPAAAPEENERMRE
jgi:precorrin-2 dehydrogenase/sirohydrochlorin ferrochelatase